MYFVYWVILLVILVTVSMCISQLMRENREAHLDQDKHHHKI